MTKCKGTSPDRARVIAELADSWTQGMWAEVLLFPTPNGPIATAQAVGDWLRAEARNHEREATGL